MPAVAEVRKCRVHQDGTTPCMHQALHVTSCSGAACLFTPGVQVMAGVHRTGKAARG